MAADGAAARHIGTPPSARARALAPLLTAAAPRIEAAHQLPQDVLDALHAAGMFRLLLPRDLGGAETEPAEFAAAIEALATADASTAWVVGQASGCSMAAAWLDEAAARRVFGAPDATLAWGALAEGSAVAVPGGFRVSADWRFASGGRHAAWLGGHVPVADAGGAPPGRPVELTLLFPREAASMAPDWRVVGLRGTGSDSYAVRDLFVPAAFSFLRDDPATRRAGGPLYRFPTNAIYASAFASVALGIARAMLDALIALARAEAPRGAAPARRDSTVLQAGIAAAEADLQASRAFLHAALRDAWTEAAGPDGLTLEARMRIRLAASHASRRAREVAETAYHAAGAGAIFEDAPFERRLRDMHAVSQQVQARDSHFETVGRHLLGLAASTRFL